jgi:hypothetical protein
MFKETQDNIINAAERALRKTGLGDKTLTALLRGIHYFFFFMPLYIIAVGSKRWFIGVLIFIYLIYAMFLIFNACILTKLEYRFARDDFNVIDPLLLIFNAAKTKANRYNYTVGLNVFIGISLPLIYYLRFCRD